MLYALHSAAMRAHVERIWGWDEALQSEMFRSRFDPSATQVIQYDAQAIGMLSVEKRERDLFIRQIQILPAYQNRGIRNNFV